MVEPSSSPVDAARRLAPEVRARADEIEQARRLPADLVAALARAGLFRMLVPRALGGGEVDPATMVHTIELIAAADGSAGWCVMIGATTGVVSAYLPAEVAREVYGADPAAVTGGVFAPSGQARLVDGGYHVRGRWAFASGCEHCAWLMGGCVVLDGAAPRLLPNGMPDARLMLFPATQARVIDTWTVSGLRGTGSHDIAVEDLLVPAGHSVSLVTDRPQAAGALYHVPVFGLLALGIAAVALGVARRAIDELVALAGAKTPAGSRRRLAERAAVQAAVAEAEALVGAARALVLQTVAALWEAGHGGRADDARRAGAPAARGHPCHPQRRARHRSHVRRRRRHRRVRHQPAAALLPRRARGDPAHHGGAPDLRARRPDPARPGRRHDHAVMLTTADFTTLQLERIDDVLRVTIAHPTKPLNAVDARLHHDLTALFAGLRRETAARAVLLTGRGRAFSAGGDFAWFPSLQDPAALEALRRDAKQMIWDLLDTEVPIVAAVNGHAMGLGASIALLCDVIFMADTATIGDPHVRVGLVAGDGGAVIWPLTLGPARAKQYLLTGDPLPAAEAERIGLVNRVVPAADLDREAMAFARRLAAGAPLAVRYTKLAVNKLVKDALNMAFDTSTALELVTFRSADHAEALAALAEKRPPVFRGR